MSRPIDYLDATIETRIFASWTITQVISSLATRSASRTDSSEGEYYDLSQIPERYTGYAGRDAHNIWRSIYEENCFGVSEMNLVSKQPAEPVSPPDTMTDVLREESDSDTCLEKRVYYKVISGRLTVFLPRDSA